MITVREATEVLTGATSFVLGYNDSSMPFNKDDAFMMQAFGDYGVESIGYIADNRYEIAIAMRPVKAKEVQ